MEWSVVAGTAKHVRVSPCDATHVLERAAAALGARRRCRLRVGGTPVTVALSYAARPREGDAVAVVGRAGRARAGDFRGLALRNDTTGVLSAGPCRSTYLGALLAVACGALCGSVWAGAPLVTLGLGLLHRAVRTTRALGRLRRAPQLV